MPFTFLTGNFFPWQYIPVPQTYIPWWIIALIVVLFIVVIYQFIVGLHHDRIIKSLIISLFNDRMRKDDVYVWRMIEEIAPDLKDQIEKVPVFGSWKKFKLWWQRLFLKASINDEFAAWLKSAKVDLEEKEKQKAKERLLYLEQQILLLLEKKIVKQREVDAAIARSMDEFNVSKKEIEEEIQAKKDQIFALPPAKNEKELEKINIQIRQLNAKLEDRLIELSNNLKNYQNRLKTDLQQVSNDVDTKVKIYQEESTLKRTFLGIEAALSSSPKQPQAVYRKDDQAIADQEEENLANVIVGSSQEEPSEGIGWDTGDSEKPEEETTTYTFSGSNLVEDGDLDRVNGEKILNFEPSDLGELATEDESEPKKRKKKTLPET